MNLATTHGRFLRPTAIALLIVALVASATEFTRAMAMLRPAVGPGQQHHDMHSMRTGLHGMPVGEMPAMFVAGLSIVALAMVWMMAGRQLAGSATTGTALRRPRLQIAVCTAALAVDVSKTSTLGFVIPGMRTEYGLDAPTAALLSVGGLSGTAVGSYLVSKAGSRLTRRQVYVIACLTFAATSCCGMMPTFTGNVVMCFLMGMSVGGLAPILVASIRDTCQGRRADGTTVGACVAATAGGFLVAAGGAALLIPTFGWRIMWLIGVPTAFILVLLAPFVSDRVFAAKPDQPAFETTPPPLLVDRQRVTAAVPQQGLVMPAWLRAVLAVSVGMLTFAVSTWAPTIAASSGAPHADRQLAIVALLMVPVAITLWLGYHKWGTRRILFATTSVCAAAVGVQALRLTHGANVWAAAGILVVTLASVQLVSSLLLPAAANESGDENGRLSRVAWMSTWYRIGGLLGPLMIAQFVTTQASARWALATLSVACLLVTMLIGRSSGAAFGPASIRWLRLRSRAPEDEHNG